MCSCVPAADLRLQYVQQQLLDVAGGQLVHILGRQFPRTDLQLVLHGLEDPAGDTGGGDTPERGERCYTELSVAPAQ